jgi:hypothetical protein
VKGFGYTFRNGYTYRADCTLQPEVGEVPTFQASDTDTNLLIVSADLFHGF